MGGRGSIYLPGVPAGSPHPPKQRGEAGLPDRSPPPGGRSLRAGAAAPPSGAGGGDRAVGAVAGAQLRADLGHSDHRQRIRSAGGDPTGAGRERRPAGGVGAVCKWGGHPQPPAAGDPGAELGGGERLRLPGGCTGAGTPPGPGAAGSKDPLQYYGPPRRAGAGDPNGRRRAAGSAGNVGDGGAAADFRRGGHRNLRHSFHRRIGPGGGAHLVYPHR